MSERIHELLARTQQSAVVGRADEQASFRSGLLRGPPGFRIVYVVGPGGIGKSTLLHLFGRLARELGFETVEIDGRDIEPTAPGLTKACADAAGAGGLDEWIDRLARRPTVLLLDAYDTIRSLDNWIRSQFLPLLPSTTQVVLASRFPPAAEWRIDPAFAGLMEVVRLRNLGRRESRELLRRRGVPDAEHGAILDFTHGHPLALSLVAELYQQDAAIRFRPEVAPVVVHTLVESLMDSVVDAERRTAIEVSALVRSVTEELLEATVPTDDPTALFEWLAQRSFMEAHIRGIAPHDLAREAVAADLRWRNPNRYASLHDDARSHYRSILAARPADQAVTLMDYVYLHRDSPFVKPYLDFSVEEEAHVDALHPEDHAVLVEAAGRHEGPQAAAILGLWLDLAPESVTVIRSMAGSITGFWLELLIHEYDDAGEVDFDPLAAEVIRQSRLRADEQALLFRMWMDLDSYQAITPVQSRIFIEFVRKYLSTPRLAQTFVVCGDPDFWEPLFSYADMPRYRDLEHAELERPYGVYGHDWRVRSPMAWLDLMAAREVSEEPDLSSGPPSADLVFLSEKDFRSAVFDVLRDFNRPSALESSPLLHASVVVRHRRDGSEIEALRKLVKQVVEDITADTEHAKLYPVLYHGFLNPAPTHEAAARQAHVSYSTFRRYAARGRELVADRLWALELDPAM